jgi:hypothetical protein
MIIRCQEFFRERNQMFSGGSAGFQAAALLLLPAPPLVLHRSHALAQGNELVGSDFPVLLPQPAGPVDLDIGRFGGTEAEV